MAVIAMKVVEAENHPNADRLRIYRFDDGSGSLLQVVANLTNVYEVGDVAAVARIGTIMNDGLEIKEAKPRNVPSFGMAIGKVEDAVGTDLTAKFNCR